MSGASIYQGEESSRLRYEVRSCCFFKTAFRKLQFVRVKTAWIRPEKRTSRDERLVIARFVIGLRFWNEVCATNGVALNAFRFERQSSSWP
jgi:hypothetical protein